MGNFLLLLIGYALLYSSVPGLEFNVSGNMRPLDFWSAVYFSVVTVVTVGYGDITPVGFYSSALVVAEVLCGVYYLGVFLATTVSWVRGIDRPKTLGELLEESRRLDERDRAWSSRDYAAYMNT